MFAELQRQAHAGSLNAAGEMDDSAHVWIAGTVDLAAMADITERALRGEFNL